MNTKSWIIAGLLLIAMIGWTLLNRPVPSHGNSSGFLPHAQAQRMDQMGTWSPQESQGKLRLIAFWATWCSPCREEIPHLNAFQEKHPQQVAVIGASVDEDQDALKEFLLANTLKYPVILATSQLLEAAGNVQSIPTTMVVDGSGKILEIITQPLDLADLEDILTKYSKSL